MKNACLYHEGYPASTIAFTAAMNSGRRSHAKSSFMTCLAPVATACRFAAAPAPMYCRRNDDDNCTHTKVATAIQFQRLLYVQRLAKGVAGTTNSNAGEQKSLTASTLGYWQEEGGSLYSMLSSFALYSMLTSFALYSMLSSFAIPATAPWAQTPGRC